MNTNLDMVNLTVEQYHRMLETGILAEGEPIELLNGLLVYKQRGKKMTVNPLHALIVNRLIRLAPLVEPFGYHLRLQNPITIPEYHEPEPDAAIVQGDIDDYIDHHPYPDQTFCVIEVADSSLEHDRATKLAIYAAADIPNYIIINLVERKLEFYQQPLAAAGHYQQVLLLTTDDILQLNFPDQQTLRIPAAQWLP